VTKILVAEDERDIRELIGYTLRFGGFEVTLATNGAEAIEMAATENPDLIILDVRMPRMTGYEACEKLKLDPQVRHIPVVFLSAKGQEAEIRQGIEAGAVGYIIKPFVPDELVRQVREIIEKTSHEADTADADAADAAAAPPAAPDETADTPTAQPAAHEPKPETEKPSLSTESGPPRQESMRRRFDWSSDSQETSESKTETPDTDR
jgi:CheY-like chemotaxis protein